MLRSSRGLISSVEVKSRFLAFMATWSWNGLSMVVINRFVRASISTTPCSMFLLSAARCVGSSARISPFVFVFLLLFRRPPSCSENNVAERELDLYDLSTVSVDHRPKENPPCVHIPILNHQSGKSVRTAKTDER